MNATLEKFGDPATRLATYDHWTVLLRPQQVTLGAMVLVCTDPVTQFSALSPEAFSDLQRAVTGIEHTLAQTLRPDKINYLMLMMVDPDVHFHVLPRYGAAREFARCPFSDTAWPGPPDLRTVNETSEETREELIDYLREHWN